MASRSLNKVQLIGNLTRDPELRYTPQGTAVCTFGLATNRGWTTDSGERKEEAEFHRVVAWNKLAEICSQFLTKGKRCYVEGRLQTRQWNDQEGAQRQTTEIVIEEMIVLDSRREGEQPDETMTVAGEETKSVSAETAKSSPQPEPVKKSPTGEESDKKTAAKSSQKKEIKKEEDQSADVNPDDIPF